MNRTKRTALLYRIRHASEQQGLKLPHTFNELDGRGVRHWARKAGALTPNIRGMTPRLVTRFLRRLGLG